MAGDGKASASWIVAGASVRGTSHVRRGAPNQDAADWFLSGDERFCALAVADGHGASLHSRSERGARFAVTIALAKLRSLVEGAGDAAIDLDALKEQLLLRWREAAFADLACDPLPPHQFAALAERGLDPTGAYGTTLLAAGIGPTTGVVIQIGDGHVFIVARDGSAATVLPSQEFPGDATFSLCLPNALNLIETWQLDANELGRIAGFVLATDGYCKSFRDDEAAVHQVKTMVKRLSRDSAAAVMPELESWLGQVSEAGSGDDISVIIAARTAILGC